MNRVDELWLAIAQLLDNGWPGAFDDDRAKAYRFLLAPFAEQVVPTDAGPQPVLAEAIRNLTPRARFMPSAGEIAGECVRLLGDPQPGDFTAPAPAEVLRVCEEAAYGEAGQVSAVARVERELGPVAAGWFESLGGRLFWRDHVRLLDDDSFGTMNRANLTRSYTEFVSVQRDRSAKGLGLTVVAGGRLQRGGAPLPASSLLRLTDGGAS